MNSNTLKITACVSMVLDHIGYILFPEVLIFRYLGRLAFPVFAFFVAEGVLRTSDRKKYLLRLLGFGVICQAISIVFPLLMGEGFYGIELNIFFTLALGAIVCCVWQAAAEDRRKFRLFLLLVAGIAAFTYFCSCTQGLAVFPGHEPADILIHSASGGRFIFFIEYGFMGIVLPWFAFVVAPPAASREACDIMDAAYNALAYFGRVIIFGIGLVLLSLQYLSSAPYQFFCLLALPLLFLYNGTRGRLKLKYFFYIFYPVHLGIIYLIDMLL